MPPQTLHPHGSLRWGVPAGRFTTSTLTDRGRKINCERELARTRPCVAEAWPCPSTARRIRASPVRCGYVQSDGVWMLWLFGVSSSGKPGATCRARASPANSPGGRLRRCGSSPARNWPCWPFGRTPGGYAGPAPDAWAAPLTRPRRLCAGRRPTPTPRREPPASLLAFQRSCASGLLRLSVFAFLRFRYGHSGAAFP